MSFHEPASKRSQQESGDSPTKKQKDVLVPARISTALTLLGDSEIQQVLKFLCKDDLLRLALVCKSMESQVEERNRFLLQTVWNHHHLPRPASLPGSFRRGLHQTMMNPLYGVNLPETQGVFGCRALALSPSEDQLAIADIAIEQMCSGNRVAFKVVLWDLSRKEVVRTIHHDIVPAEQLNNGNYSLQLFWLENDLLVTCSPASICVWAALTGRMLHCYRRHPESSPMLFSGDLMRSFVRQGDTKILFLAERNSVHTFDAQNGLVQANICRATSSIKKPMRDLVVCGNHFLIAVLGVESKNHGLLVVDLEHSTRAARIFAGNYCTIFQPSPSSRSLLAFRDDGDGRTGVSVTSCFVDVLEVSETGMLVHRRTIPLAFSDTPQVLAAFEDRFFAQYLVNTGEVMVVNSTTGEFESPFSMEDQASFFPQCTVVAPKRKELMIGLDLSVESGSAAVLVYSLLDINRR